MPIVTRQTIAECVPYRYLTVTEWARTGKDFPKAIGTIGRSYVYDLDKVAAWLEAKGKATPEQIDKLRQLAEGVE